MLLTSCQPQMYTAMLPNVPTFEDKGQFRAGVDLDYVGLGFKLSYSPVKHLFVQGNGWRCYQRKYSSGHEYNNSLEGAIGGYHLDNNIYIHGLLGYGEGKSLFNDSGSLAEPPSGHGTFNKKFVQCGLAHKNSSKIWGLVFRYGTVKYKIEGCEREYLEGTNYTHNITEVFFYMGGNLYRNLDFMFYEGLVLDSDHKTPCLNTFTHRNWVNL